MQRLFALFIFLIFCNFVNANQLQKIQNQIQNLRTALSHDQNQQSNVQEGLKNLETNIGNSTIQLQKTQHNLIQQQGQLNTLSKQQKQYEKQLQLQKNTLAQQLRTIYIFGQEQYLKLLLNQENPEHVSRILTYYHYINQQRIRQITQFNITLAKLHQTKELIQQHSQKLQSLQNQQRQEHVKLESTKQQRQKLLVTLNTKIINNQQQLNTLIANKQALEHLLNRLITRKHFIATMVFPHHTGKFPWPIRGRITQGFGIPIQQSQLKTSGVLIQAPEGEDVNAIAPGQIVFANWMAGYGLLVIVDHGNGFMSIYGRNHSLYKKVGDKVNTGDLLATVGDTGGFSQPALYFALRHDGKAVNPEQWCG